MSNSQRDTQFRGFAKAVVEDLFRFHALDARQFVNQGDKIEKIIARRAYDLVGHTIGNVEANLDEELPDFLSLIADMTELPKEQEEDTLEEVREALKHLGDKISMPVISVYIPKPKEQE